jgi:hypothetical protein
MELGKRLLIMKEMTPHGEFEKRIEILGFSHEWLENLCLLF